jgi:uncharacterized protein (TIGR03067 family)
MIIDNESRTMLLRSLGIPVAISLLVNGACALAAPGGKKELSDLAKLQGEWKIELWIQGGRKFDVKATWTIKDNKYTLSLDRRSEEGSIKVDETKTLTTIDLDITDGSCKGKEQLGVVKVDGDKLFMCFALPGVAERPTELSSSAENRWILITLKRVK